MLQKTSLDFEKLFHSLPGRYIIFAIDDPDFTILEESQSHADVAMIKRKSIIGRPLLEVFPDTSEKYTKTGVSDLIESLRKVIETRKPDVLDSLRYDIKNPDGTFEIRYWQVEHRPVFDTTGNVKHICQVTNDITNELTTRNRLAQTEEQLDRALSAGQIGTWEWDMEKNLVFADKNLALLFGIPAKKAADGLSLDVFTNAIHPEDQKQVLEEINTAILKKGPYEKEYRTISKAGEVHWVIARGTVETRNGKPVRFPGVLVDITSRKLAEQKLQFISHASTTLSSSLDYKKTLKNVAQLAVTSIADWCTVDMLDEQGNIEQLAVAHRDPEQVKLAKELRKQQGPPDLNAPSGTGKVLRTGEAEFYPQITDDILVAADQNKKQLVLLRKLGLRSAIIVPIMIGESVIGTLTFVSANEGRYFDEEDYSLAQELAKRASLSIENAVLYKNAKEELHERKRLEGELRNANSSLEAKVKKRTKQLEETNINLLRSNKELEDFAYVASHDLQEPLRKIQAFGDLLENEFGENLGEGRDYLDRMRSAAARMSVLIEDLLAFSRVTTHAREFTRLDLNQITKEVLSDLETRIANTKGTVTLDNLPIIEGDATQMRQLMQNLIGNALKFHKTNDSPKVHISAKELTPANGVTIKKFQLLVSDNGVGFDPKYLDRIFAVFQRLHGRKLYEGTGIGLAVCRKIAERHGGTITATSAPGVGSTFIVTLPIRQKKEK